MTTPKPSTTTNTADKTNNTANVNKMLQKYMLRKKSLDEERDGEIFSSMLDKKDEQQNIIAAIQGRQEQSNQQDFQEDNQQKKDDNKVQDVKKNEVEIVNEIHQLDKSQEAEFCNALVNNHEKHYFEVNIPKVGNFNIGTELQKQGQKQSLKFDVSSSEKDACEWLNQHKKTIEKNVSADLKLDVSLGIQHVL